jgi:hypothetical protein
MTSTETKNEKWINSVSETSDFTIDIQQLFESNALILGSRHTGKSDLAMMICDKANAIVIVFDPSLDWIVRSNIKRYVKVEPYAILDVPSESVIYDVSLCSPQDQQKIVENFSKKLFEHQAQAENRRQYLMIFEESHTYFYQGCMRAQNMRNTVRLLSVGRNVSIACVLISQFASMLDKFAVKLSISQAWFGFTREANDVRYLAQILGTESKQLAKLNDGEFLYSTRNSVRKINIEPYESQIVKTEETPNVPQSTPTEPITRPRTHDTSTTIARLLIVAIFAIVMLKSL